MVCEIPPLAAPVLCPGGAKIKPPFEMGVITGRLDKRSTGIGLSLVKSAADLLGHPVRITSEAGKGTTVRIDTKRVQLDTV